MKQDTLRRWVRLLLILVGVGILAYPSVSEYLSQRNSSRATASYDDAVLQMENARREELLAQAQDYNRQLAGSDATALTPESYWDLLNVDATGMMGYLEIPRLNTTIPIYHGTEEDVLQVGIGHLQTTSLPVGGPSTHAALSGHRGLPSRSLFTGLDQMEVGDHFYITVLGETLCYTVDQILTVLPHEMDALAITPGQDYVTLITCTPYGINSHRLLVRGVRTAYHPQQREEAAAVSFWQSLPMQYRHLLLGVGVLAGILLLRGFVQAGRKRRKGRTQRHE